MAKQGWITIDRAIQENWLWKDKPFSKGQAWIDLILLANHRDNKLSSGNELIVVKRGSFITTEKKLMERWGWGNTKVRSFLTLLKNDGMIKQETTKKQSAITIVNYGVYQDKQSANKVPTKYEQSADKVQTKLNNNDNNDNKYNNIKKENIKERKNTTYDEILSKVVDDSLRELYGEYIKMRKMIKSPMTDRALTMLIKKVEQLEPTDIERQKRLLETAIMNNWKSVYPLKNEEGKKDWAAYDLDAFEKKINSDD